MLYNCWLKVVYMLHSRLNLCVVVTSGTNVYQTHPPNQQKITPVEFSYYRNILAMLWGVKDGD